MLDVSDCTKFTFTLNVNNTWLPQCHSASKCGWNEWMVYIDSSCIYTYKQNFKEKKKKRKILIETTQAQIKLKITPIILRNVNNVIQHFYSTQSYLYKVRENYIGTMFGLHCSSFPLAKKIVCLMMCQKIVNKTCRNNGERATRTNCCNTQCKYCKLWNNRLTKFSNISSKH